MLKPSLGFDQKRSKGCGKPTDIHSSRQEHKQFLTNALANTHMQR
jgi:hypothetical protein